ASGALVRLTSCVVVARSALSESYALSLHDALPICERVLQLRRLPSADRGGDRLTRGVTAEHAQRALTEVGQVAMEQDEAPVAGRSEEHTSELQSLAYLVCRLLLEKKNAHPGPPHPF